MPKKKMTIEDLAGIVKKGFKEAAKKKEVDKQISELARITAKGFTNVDRRFEQVDKRFKILDKKIDSLDKRLELVEKRLEIIEGRLEHIEARLARMESDVSHLRNNFVSQKEFEDLTGRVKYLEVKLGIESGK